MTILARNVSTIQTARKNGLDICSGVIVGMGESTDDLIKMTRELDQVHANSIPINFFIPVEGHRIENYQKLTPQQCVKILCVFRLTNPTTELRAAAGREYHLRGMQSLCLYPANSIFSQGYLLTEGDPTEEARQMIEDAGFYVDVIEE